MATLAESLSDFALALRLGDVPADVLDKVKQHTLDQIGAQIAGYGQRWNTVIRDYALAEAPDGPSTVVGSARRIRPEWAALSNGSAGQGFEIDDYHPAALIHPGAVTVPAALAVAEAAGSSGEELLAALVVGFEIAVRVSAAAQPGMNHDRGVHPTSAVGPFSSAAVAARLLGNDAKVLVNAMGIAGSHAGGTVEYTQSGGEVKRLHAGLASMAGIRSVSLAAAGLTGPPTVLEGRKGVLQAMSSTPRPDEAVAALGSDWQVLGTAIKPNSCNAFIQAPIHALSQIIELDGVDPLDIRAVEVGVDRMGKAVTGAIGPDPQEMVQAQFSVHYSLGLRMVLGSNDFDAYRSLERGGETDVRVRDYASRVTVHVDPECDAAFPQAFMARVTAVTSDGTRTTRATYAPGSPANPLGAAGIEEKFARITTPVVGEESAGELIRLIGALEDVPAVGELARYLPTS